MCDDFSIISYQNLIKKDDALTTLKCNSNIRKIALENQSTIHSILVQAKNIKSEDILEGGLYYACEEPLSTWGL